MDSIEIYLKLIDRATFEHPGFESEKHHIIPRCMGGNDLKNNLVSLTIEEHFLAHKLLAKIYYRA